MGVLGLADSSEGAPLSLGTGAEVHSGCCLFPQEPEKVTKAMEMMVVPGAAEFFFLEQLGSKHTWPGADPSWEC